MGDDPVLYRTFELLGRLGRLSTKSTSRIT
jgi:hypothetical protein